MHLVINRLKLVFLGIFALACAGIWAYQVMWVWPRKECEANGQWWDSSTRICASPIYIPALTGRPEGMSRREWSEQQARKLVTQEQY